MDFDHVAFVIKGVNSSYPIPAGGYKISQDLQTKDININFGDNFGTPTQTLSLSENFSDNYFSGANIQGDILIKNVGNVMSDPKNIIVTTDFLKPRSQKIYFGKIPPYGSISIPVSFNKPSLLTNKKDNIRIAINENYISKEIGISPFILNKYTIGGGIVFAIIIITTTVIIFKTGNLSFLRRKR